MRALRTETACDPGRNQGSLIAVALKALFFSEQPTILPPPPTQLSTIPHALPRTALSSNLFTFLEESIDP